MQNILKVHSEIADKCSMKKFYVLLAFFGLLAGYTAQSNHLLEDERDVFFPITREQLIVKKTNVAELVDLSTLSHSKLLFEVYNKKVLLDSQNQQPYFEMIQKRLASDYPVKSVRHSKSFEREVRARLELLQAMAHFWKPAESANIDKTQLKNFLSALAKSKNENLMVRRQAYKNWLALQQGPNLPSNNRLASLAAHSDENLIGSLAESAH